MFLFFKPRIIGRKNLITKGKVIVLCNHKSVIDPVLFSYLFGRPIHWMAKTELFKNKLFAGFITRMHAFPVNRGAGDLASIRHAMRLLHDGKVLGIFPEGTRIKEDEIGHFEPGVTMMALKTEAYILPIYTDGNYGIFKRVKAVVGELINLNEYTGGKHNYTAVTEATQYLQTRMVMMKNMLQEGKK
jgi:1-acyl-sn-glycerol-3-phosphate acyltransferase